MNSYPEQQYRRFLKLVFLVLVALAALWATIDLTLLAILPKSTPVTPEFEMVEGLGQTMRRSYQGVHFTTDENGFRRSHTPSVTQGEKRILVLGDSVTFGLGLMNGDDWPSQLEKYLRDRGVRVTVLNAAVIGMMTATMRNAIDYYVKKEKPDLVIVQNTGNILAKSGNMEITRKFSNAPGDFLKDQFPALASGSAVPTIYCRSAEGKETQNIQAVQVPRAIKAASEQSPLAAHIVSFTQKVHRALASPTRPPVPSNVAQMAASPKPAPARAVDPLCKDYLHSEFAHMGDLIETARANGVPLALIKPTYSLNWGPEWMSDHLDRSKNLPEVFTKNPVTLLKLKYRWQWIALSEFLVRNFSPSEGDRFSLYLSSAWEDVVLYTIHDGARKAWTDFDDLGLDIRFGFVDMQSSFCVSAASQKASSARPGTGNWRADFVDWAKNSPYVQSVSERSGRFDFTILWTTAHSTNLNCFEVCKLGLDDFPDVLWRRVGSLTCSFEREPYKGNSEDPSDLQAISHISLEFDQGV